MTRTRTSPLALIAALAAGIALSAGAATIAYGAGYRINKATDEQLQALDELRAAFGTPTPTTSATVTAAQWGQPASIDGYTLTITKPVDKSDDYPCDGCDRLLFVSAVTITAGAEPIPVDAINPHGVDANGGNIGMTQLLDNPLAAGATRKVPAAQIAVDRQYAAQRWTLRQTSRDGKTAVEWTYGLRPASSRSSRLPFAGDRQCGENQIRSLREFASPTPPRPPPYPPCAFHACSVHPAAVSVSCPSPA